MWVCESEEGAAFITCTEKNGEVIRAERPLRSVRDAIQVR